MKRFIVSVLVLCVVAPASFGAILAEYAWTGAENTAGNFTDSTWSCNQTGQPVVPFESANTTDWAAYARPAVNKAGAVITVNTDLSPTNLGFQQFQLSRGTLVVDAGGEFRMHTGYMYCSANINASGLVVQNGGQYINTGTGTGNQIGHLLTYQTLNSIGFTTVSGPSLFDTKIMYVGRHGNTTAGRNGKFNVEGSGSTINVGTYGPGGNNTTGTWKFTTDAGGVSAVNIANLLAFQQGVSLTHTSNVTILDFVIGADPTLGQVFTLFDLAEGAVRTGNLKSIYGATIVDNGRIELFKDGNSYWFDTSYTGGLTGNDVTLTYLGGEVPEPATMALLSLGGLFLARRRRA